MNLFLATRRLTEAKEAHLTEFFAAVLESDAQFREAIAYYLLGPHVSRVGWSRPDIVRVDTRVVDSRSGCGPVMRLTLADGHVILCEQRSETSADNSPRREDELHLLECLESSADAVVCVRPTWHPLLPEILAHPKYLRPEEGDHFLWRDFYPLLRAAESNLAAWLTEGFDLLGFAPPSPQVSDFSADMGQQGTDLSDSLSHLWGETRRWAEDQGWRTKAGSRVELQLFDNDASKVSSVFVTLVTVDRFVIRATPRSVADAEVVLESFRAVARSCMIPVQVESTQVPGTDGPTLAVKVRTRLRDVLGQDLSNPEQIEGRLRAYVTLFLARLSEPGHHRCTAA